MEVTSVNLRLVVINKVKAICSVTLDDEFVVHGIRLIDGDNGMFVAMPSRKLPSGIFKDIAHPINPDMRGKLQDAVMNEYNRLAEQIKLGHIAPPEAVAATEEV